MRTLIDIFNGFLEGKYSLTFESAPPSPAVKNLQVLLGYLVCAYLLPSLWRILFLNF